MGWWVVVVTPTWLEAIQTKPLTSILNLVTVLPCSAVPFCVSHGPALGEKLLGGFEFELICPSPPPTP